MADESTKEEPSDFDAVIAERLPLHDDYLAKAGVDLQDRPFRATLDFIHVWIVAIDLGDGGIVEPNAPDMVKTRWFGMILRLVQKWYRQRYGDAMTESTERTLTAFVLIWSTAFQLSIPSIIPDPEAPPGSAWLRFPNKVLPAEKPLKWIRPAPSTEQLSPSERHELEVTATAVATSMRSINLSLLGIPHSSTDLAGLLTAARSHLTSSAVKAIQGGHPSLEIGCWDLHMAAECSLKAYVKVQTGSFPKSHDLDCLFRLTSNGLPQLQPADLKRLPPWKVAVAYRYGDGPKLSVVAFFEIYRAVLRIVDAALNPLATFRLGDARIDLARLPWHEE
jgi:hypothetical protein